MKRNPQKFLLDHSKAKVELYTRYLSRFLNIISRDGFTKKIYLFDLFSGEGKYDDGGKGSPVAALETIKNHYYSNNQQCLDMLILFNDINKDKIEKLKAESKKIFVPKNCIIEFRKDDYKDIVKEVELIISRLKNEKAVVFIDPYGYKEIKISNLRELLANGKSEVLLFLPIYFMSRFANTAIEDSSSGKEPLHFFLKELFGNDLSRFNNALDFIDKLKEGFKKNLTKFFVDTFILEREPGQYFSLFFFTSHIRGFEKMLETKWELDEQQGRGFRFEKSMTLFSSSESTNFPDKLLEFLKSGKRYNKDVFEFVLHQGFLPKHINEVFRDWQKEGKMIVSSNSTEKIRSGSYYINYENYRDKPNRVFYQIKY